MSRDFRLSKSKIMARTHARLARERAYLQNGHLFGECARPLMGEGEPVGHVPDMTRALAETRIALERASAGGSMVYEAAFSYRNVVARADGFATCADGWHMTEAKAASAIKDYSYQDCAIQV
ncbi:hypothetical protein [Caballeronia sp. Lep1P3]|uniref:hypothetical protein n=1 Tax=Caballeronia sp. Lep1P3 TaxID=2878150 RepID=UPI001FD28B54|nr:hypothetical protein [Caballeronia sp. Lep1P3]